MSRKHADETDEDSNYSISRRRVLATGLAGVGAMSVPGVAAADNSSQSNVPEFNRDDWVVEAEAKTPNTETEVYVGPNKTTDSELSFDPNKTAGKEGMVQPQAIGSLSEKIRLGTIPPVVPVIGGSPISLKISATFGFTEVSAGIAICVGGRCLSIAGAGFSYQNAEACIGGKGSIGPVPIELDGCITFNPSLNPIGLEVGGSVTPCVGRNLCDASGSRRNWDYNRFCGLCKTFGLSATL